MSNGRKEYRILSRGISNIERKKKRFKDQCLRGWQALNILRVRPLLTRRAMIGGPARPLLTRRVGMGVARNSNLLGRKELRRENGVFGCFRGRRNLLVSNNFGEVRPKSAVFQFGPHFDARFRATSARSGRPRLHNVG